VDIPGKNLDNVFKEALVLFKNKTLDFLGLTGIAPIGESLRSEAVQIEVTWEFQDLAFATQDGRGLNFETEAHLSYDDLLRFGGYNISLSRVHKREFVTVIFGINPTSLIEVKTEQLHFMPKIIHCSKIDADAMLSRLKKAIASGQPINELEAIYLPLFHSKGLTPTKLFIESAELIKSTQLEDNLKQKMLTLLITLSGKIVDRVELLALAEEVRRMGNVVIEVFEELGEKKGVERQQEESARKMLSDGLDVLDIIRYTGIDAERLYKIREIVHAQTV